MGHGLEEVTDRNLQTIKIDAVYVMGPEKLEVRFKKDFHHASFLSLPEGMAGPSIRSIVVISRFVP
jgi:hypothetical protein